MADHYYDREDLARFPEIGKNSPDLAEKFFDWYGAVFADGALSAREKSLIALAVAHAVQCPYCIDAYSRDALEKGADLEQMTEAVHVAAAIRGGASLVHGVQMRGHAAKAGDVTMRLMLPLFCPAGCRSRRPTSSTTRSVRLAARLRVRRGASSARGNGRSPATDRGPPDQRRQALQPDLPSLPRRRRARSPRGHDARDDGAVPRRARADDDPDRRHHRRRAGAEPRFPLARRRSAARSAGT